MRKLILAAMLFSIPLTLAAMVYVNKPVPAQPVETLEQLQQAGSEACKELERGDSITLQAGNNVTFIFSCSEDGANDLRDEYLETYL